MYVQAYGFGYCDVVVYGGVIREKRLKKAASDTFGVTHEKKPLFYQKPRAQQ
jgi:hypothetical protein